ncbi:MAG TPA: polysaccharide lyase family protein [Terriglobia bacterium]|nr:polysaccharide lyase family protein [Terriglobia bacterium]
MVGRFILAAVFLATLRLAAAPQTPRATVTEDGASFTLSNGIVTARILKSNGDIRSLQYQGTEILTDRSGHAGGYWSHDTTGGKSIVTKVTIDPTGNNGERAEVSIKGVSGGVKMGHGPGAAADGDFPADIEIRYTLGRGDSGIYTYCIFEHLPEYTGATMTEARFAAKLADFFDWISIDARRNKYYPEEIPGEDKYVYTAVQSESPAFGFSSTKRNIGFFFINPSMEYLSGGPTKPEFLAHRDTTAVQAPVVLNYWRSSHYGGANVTVGAGERWTKVIGPFMLYVNEGPDPLAMWREAQSKAAAEAEKWPYGWAHAENYAGPSQRGAVRGRLALTDPLLKAFPGRVMVGLASPTYTPPGARAGAAPITWQTDAKHYEFWASSNNSDGRFTIPKVSPGVYTLYAFADGILGEFSKADVRVGEGETVDLGDLQWQPTRRGRQIWEIGVANRTGTEFAGGDRFFEPDITLQYPKMFPSDVTYIIGESQPGRNWFYAHVPHNADSGARVQPFSGVSGQGRPTPYTVRFRMDTSPKGTATLRLAISGTGTRSLQVSVNGSPAGQVQLGPGDGVITRHQAQGIWYEREFPFDASTLKAGDNTLTLTVPAGPVNNGVIYDYLRLELDEGRQFQ